MKIVFKENVEPEATFGSLKVKDVFRIAGSECLYMKINWESALCIDGGEIDDGEIEMNLENCIFDFVEDKVVKPLEAELIVCEKRAED